MSLHPDLAKMAGVDSGFLHYSFTYADLTAFALAVVRQRDAEWRSMLPSARPAVQNSRLASATKHATGKRGNMTPEQIADALEIAKAEVANPSRSKPEDNWEYLYQREKLSRALLAEHERANKTEADCLRYMAIANEYARDAARWRAVRERIDLEVIVWERDCPDEHVRWRLYMELPWERDKPATVDEAADRLRAEQEKAS